MTTNTIPVFLEPGAGVTHRDLVLSADGRSRVQPQLKPPLLFTISFPCFFIESIIKVIRKISTWQREQELTQRICTLAFSSCPLAAYIKG